MEPMLGKVTRVKNLWLDGLLLLCYMDTALNRPLRMHRYTYQLVHLSTLIGAASYCRWKLTQTPSAGQYAENENLQRAQSFLGHQYHISHAKAQGLSWKKRGRSIRARASGWQRKLFSGHNGGGCTRDLAVAVITCKRPMQSSSRTKSPHGGGSVAQSPTAGWGAIGI